MLKKTERPTVKYRNSVRKRLNGPRCRLGCGLGLAQKALLDGGAHWCHLANTVAQSICWDNAALCQIALTLVTTAMTKTSKEFDADNNKRQRQKMSSNNNSHSYVFRVTSTDSNEFYNNFVPKCNEPPPLPSSF